MDALRRAGLTSMSNDVNALIDEPSPPAPAEPDPPAMPETTDPAELLAEGERRSNIGEVKEALAIFNRVIALDPSNAMAWFNRGVLLESEGDVRGARQSFTITIDLDSDHAPALANLAILLERSGEFTQANEVAQRALVHYPDHPTLKGLMERTAQSVVRVPTVAQEPTATKLADAPSAYDADQAVVERVMERHNISDRAALIEEARYHDTNEDRTLDEAELEAAASIVSVAEQHRVQDEPEFVPDAIPVFDLDEIASDARKLLVEKDAKGALAALKPYLHEEASSHAESWRVAASAMGMLELNSHAIPAFKHALTLQPQHPTAWRNLGAIQRREGDLDAAATSFRTALEHNPDYAKAREALMDTVWILGNIDEHVDLALRGGMEPGSAEGLELATKIMSLAIQEGEVLSHAVDHPRTIPQAQDLARSALRMMGQDPSVSRARALSILGQHADSVRTWKALIEADREDADLWDGLSRAMMEAGDQATAQRCAQKAASLRQGATGASSPGPSTAVDSSSSLEALSAPTDPMLAPEPRPQSAPAPSPTLQDAFANLPQAAPEPAIEQPAVSQTHPAVDLLSDALIQSSSMEPSTMNAASTSISNEDIVWYNRGVELMEAKKYAEALGCFERALPSFAGDDAMVIRILNGRGNAFYYLEDYPACIEAYHKAMLIDPKNVRGQTLYNMGTAYAEMERFTDAIKCFEQSVPRGLTKEEARLAQEQIRRCKLLERAKQRRS